MSREAFSLTYQSVPPPIGAVLWLLLQRTMGNQKGLWITSTFVWNENLEKAFQQSKQIIVGLVRKEEMKKPLH